MAAPHVSAIVAQLRQVTPRATLSACSGGWSGPRRISGRPVATTPPGQASSIPVAPSECSRLALAGPPHSRCSPRRPRSDSAPSSRSRRPSRSQVPMAEARISRLAEHSRRLEVDAVLWFGHDCHGWRIPPGGRQRTRFGHLATSDRCGSDAARGHQSNPSSTGCVPCPRRSDRRHPSGAARHPAFSKQSVG